MSARRVVAAVLLAVVAGAAVFWVGFGVGSSSAASRLAELRAANDSLTEENAKISRVAARVEELETSYERLRRVMGGDVAPSARDILLPPLRPDGSSSGRPGGETESDRPYSRPALWPLVESGFVTRSFGDTVPGEGPHPGLDIAIAVGSYVRASGSGVVLEAGEDGEYGRYVRIEHDDHFRSLYAHNAWTFVSAGDSVEAGEVIALSGNTGRSTAPHLHLEIERDGTRIDPLPFVSDRL